MEGGPRTSKARGGTATCHTVRVEQLANKSAPEICVAPLEHSKNSPGRKGCPSKTAELVVWQISRFARLCRLLCAGPDAKEVGHAVALAVSFS